MKFLNLTFNMLQLNCNEKKKLNLWFIFIIFEKIKRKIIVEEFKFNVGILYVKNTDKLIVNYIYFICVSIEFS